MLGIDPGSLNMGFGLLEDVPGRPPRVLEFGVLSPKGPLPLSERLLFMFNGLQKLMETYVPQEMALENVFVGNNVKTAFVLGQARGVALLAAGQMGVNVFEYAPRSVKKAIVGNGASGKEQVRHMVCALLKLDMGNAPMDASDALALAMCHLNSRALYLKGVL